MSGLLILIPIALMLGLVGLGAFMWCLKSGQYDDLEGAAWRILNDDDGSAGSPPANPDNHRPQSLRTDDE